MEPSSDYRRHQTKIPKMTNIIQKALEVGKRVPVFPCNSQKRPACRNGFKAATQDPEEIERLFSSPNASLIGMPTGASSGVSVIDIDVHGDKKGEEWRQENASLLGDTRVARTKSGGYHFYYVHEDGIRNSQGIDGCVDIRGEGGYVIHPESEGYEWQNERPIAPFPAQFNKKPKTAELYLASPVTLSNSQMSRLRDSYEGHGWNRIVSTICYNAVEHGWSDTQIRDFLAPICDGGANDADLTPILKSVRKKVSIQDNGNTSPIPIPKKPKLPLAKLGLIDIDEIEPRELVYGRDYLAGVFSLTVASGGVGKSMLVIFEACDMANQGKTVLLMMLEDDTSEVKRRIMACNIHHGLDPDKVGDNLIILTAEAKLTIAGMEHTKPVALDTDLLRASIKEYQPSAVIIDPLVRTHEMSENDNVQMNFVAMQFASIARQFNTSLMLVHHARKGADNVARGEKSRGASALMDASRNVRERRQLTENEAANINIDKQFVHEFIVVEHTKASYTAHSPTRYMRKIPVELPSGRFGSQTAATVESFAPERFEDIVTDEHREQIKEMVSLARKAERPYVQHLRAGSRNIYNEAAAKLGIGHSCVKWLVSDMISQGDLVKKRSGRSEAALAVGLD